MPVALFRRRRYPAWLWICGLLAMLCLLWAWRRLARGIVGQEWRPIEEFGVAVAPLMLFALLWELDGPALDGLAPSSFAEFLPSAANCDADTPGRKDLGQETVHGL